jgi:Arc/MetJ-type ribon-helix-helix transcriptional regulator
MVRREMSERITIRLPKSMVSEIDNLVEIGEYTNRSDIIREAVKLFINMKIQDVVASYGAKERFHDLVSRAKKVEEDEKKYLRE